MRNNETGEIERVFKYIHMYKPESQNFLDPGLVKP